MPDADELRSVLEQELSITALGSKYGVSTAKKWIDASGLKRIFDSPKHNQLLKEKISKKPLAAKRLRVDRDLQWRLNDEGDRKVLARAIVDEFNLRYTFHMNGGRKRNTLNLRLVMYDPPPVYQVADLMGVKVSLRFRKSKSGVQVPCWDCQASEYRAYKILALVRKYLVGQKAYQADVALREGPLPETWVSTGKEVYKAMLMASTLKTKEAPASVLHESFRTSLTH